MPDAQFFRDVRPQYAEVERALFHLLKSLSPEDWARPATRLWTVNDVTAHLLDGNVRALSMWRDGYFGENPGDVSTYEKLLGFLNQMNADWVKAARRLSPQVLIESIERTSQQVIEFLATLDLYARAPFSVAWAGESESRVWFHLARELTERWHHQQQIRMATGKENAEPSINTRDLYHPVLDTFMHALPHHYRSVSAPVGATVQISVTGEAHGSWTIERQEQDWKLLATGHGPATTTVTLPDSVAWRIFTRGIETKGIDLAEAEKLASISGDAALGLHALKMVAVMA